MLAWDKEDNSEEVVLDNDASSDTEEGDMLSVGTGPPMPAPANETGIGSPVAIAILCCNCSRSDVIRGNLLGCIKLHFSIIWLANLDTGDLVPKDFSLMRF